MAGWVCPQCGLDYDTVSPPDSSVAARSYPRRFRELLSGFDPDEDAELLIRRRPQPDVWSALEYTAHVADTVDTLADGLHRTATEDKPTLGFFNPDDRAESQHYNAQATSAVLDRLAQSCGDLAEAIDATDAGDWGRTAMWPWGERDALTTMRNAVHEAYHHLRDTERVLKTVRQR